MNHIALVVDWYGPYTYKDARIAAKNDFSDGLYLVTGKIKHQKARVALQYAGVAKDLYSRLNNGHHKIHQVTRDQKFWFGEIGSVGLPGPKSKVIDTRIDLAEWAHAYFLKLPLNGRKTKHAPDRPLTVLNRWWKIDYETPRTRRPHKDWPDLIEYPGKGYGAKIVWFGGRVEHWSKSDLT